MQDKEIQELVEKIKKYAKDADVSLVEKAYYFNPENVKHKKSKKYKEVAKLLNITEDTSLPVVYVIRNGKVLDQVDYLVHEDSTINQETTEQLENEYLNLISEYA